MNYLLKISNKGADINRYEDHYTFTQVAEGYNC